MTRALSRRAALPLLASPLALGAEGPFRIGVAGLVHGHARGLLRQVQNRPEVRIVGVAEPDGELIEKYRQQFPLERSIFHPTVGEMLSRTKPEAVVVHTSTFDHPAVVEACARAGVPVMMEKPLAVSMEHAQRIATASRQARIPVLVNYETTWYRSNRAAAELLRTTLRPLRKLVVHDGHQGPKEIGVGPEFFAWLTDPVRNGAGALFDFGCYGANLATWLMGNARPVSVTAVTQTNKPDIYPRVDDEATVVLRYPQAQAIIQASWNWPYSRKDMEVYGTAGYAITEGADGLRVRMGNHPEERRTAPPLPAPEDDSLRQLAAVARGGQAPGPLSSLENNLIVTEILDAARRSAQTGRTVSLAGK